MECQVFNLVGNMLHAVARCNENSGLNQGKCMSDLRTVDTSVQSLQYSVPSSLKNILGDMCD